ncbi:MAG: hypothetical protein ACP5QI_08610 [Candidatus Bathyarchaeia archaeon]
MGLIIVSGDFSHVPFLDRLSLLAGLKVDKVEALGYSYEELERMVRKGNPLILGALVERIAIVESERIKKLREEAGKTKHVFTWGRAWFPRPRQPSTLSSIYNREKAS